LVHVVPTRNLDSRHRLFLPPPPCHLFDDKKGWALPFFRLSRLPPGCGLPLRRTGPVSLFFSFWFFLGSFPDSLPGQSSMPNARVKPPFAPLHNSMFKSHAPRPPGYHLQGLTTPRPPRFNVSDPFLNSSSVDLPSLYPPADVSSYASPFLSPCRPFDPVPDPHMTPTFSRFFPLFRPHFSGALLFLPCKVW